MSELEGWTKVVGKELGMPCAVQSGSGEMRVCEEPFCNFRHPPRAWEQKYLQRNPSGGYGHIIMHRTG